jgi:hypothetical protein
MLIKDNSTQVNFLLNSMITYFMFTYLYQYVKMKLGNSFNLLVYCGDPARYDKGYNIEEFTYLLLLIIFLRYIALSSSLSSSGTSEKMLLMLHHYVPESNGR